MKREDKQRLLIFGAIIVAAVILWLLLRGKGPMNTVVQQGGTMNLPGVASLPSLAGLPPINISQGNNSYVGGSKGCSLCYSGYARLETPTPAPPYQAAPVAAMQRYFIAKGGGGGSSMTSAPMQTTTPIFSNTGIYMGQHFG